MIAQLGLLDETTVNNKLNISDLKPNHYACDRPMLSSNWVKIEGVEHIGCPECLSKYNNNN